MSTPQFSTVEFAGTDRCAACQQLISGEYYRIHGRMFCSMCANQAKQGNLADSHSQFVRGILFGSVGALLGLALYATVEIITGWIIGYVALAVGFIIAKAMLKGSGGATGRRYQIAAVALTYVAVSMAAIPVYIAQARDHDKQAQSAGSSETPDGQAAKDDSGQDDPAPQVHETPNLVKAFGVLLLVGLASPFLSLTSPGSGIIGLFILFIGMRIAWQMLASKNIVVDGPYAVGQG